MQRKQNVWSFQRKLLHQTCNLSCKGETIKQVTNFKYLGCTITPDAKCDTEIKKRMAISKDTFSKMKAVFTNRNISLNTKLNTLKAYVWSVLMYGCECWTLTSDLERKLEATEMWFIRRILKISWNERKSNEEVMEMCGYKRALITTIRRRQLDFFGHLNRADRIEKQLLCGKISGARSKGKRRTKYTDSLNSYATRNQSPINSLIRRTDNRDEWKSMTADVCNRRGT